MQAFLFLKGVRLIADQDHTYAFIMDAFDSQRMDFGTLAAWLAENTGAM